MNNKAFKAQNNEFHEGFAMTFQNGCTISVQFSKHTYSDEGHTTAEVAAWDDQGNWLMFDGEKWSEVEEGSDVTPIILLILFIWIKIIVLIFVVCFY